MPVHCRFPLFFPLSEIQNVFDVVFHALRTFLLHLVGHMAVDIQRERRRGVAEVALDGFDVIAGADGCNGEAVPLWYNESELFSLNYSSHKILVTVANQQL